MTENHSIFYDESPVITPQRVLGLAGPALADVARQDPGKEPLGVLSTYAVLVKGRGIEYPRRVPDGEVLELLRHLVLVDHEVPGPMAPQTGLVGCLDPGMEGGGLDDRMYLPTTGHYPTNSVGRMRNYRSAPCC